LAIVFVWHGTRMPKRNRDRHPVASPDVPAQREGAGFTPKPTVPWWKDAAKLSTLLLLVLLAIKLAGASYLPPNVAGYLDPLIFFLIVLSIVLSVMRRMGKR
jgi:hypothetical protein